MRNDTRRRIEGIIYAAEAVSAIAVIIAAVCAAGHVIGSII